MKQTFVRCAGDVVGLLTAQAQIQQSRPILWLGIDWNPHSPADC